MIDREKVLKGFECCYIKKNGVLPLCEVCPYTNPMEGTCDSLDELLGDALTLLKEQEPVSVQKKNMEMVGLQTWDWACGNCGQTVLFSAKFCPWCGRAVKWE